MAALNRNNEAQLLMTDFMADDSDDDDDPLSHCHDVKNQKNLESNSKARKTLIMASILCLLFMLGEIVGKTTENLLRRERSVQKINLNKF